MERLRILIHFFRPDYTKALLLVYNLSPVYGFSVLMSRFHLIMYHLLLTFD
uniref:Uncharacterized protein n=1 Tax=Octopus bimaculoides TaxID=37653 RepID=A0A0L8H2H3_OCTBM